MSDSIINRELNLRRAARCAAADLVHDARQLLASATRLAEAVRQWDPKGELEDAMILGAAETASDLLALAALSSPGVRQILADAVAVATLAQPTNEPPAVPPQPTPATEG